MKLSSSVQAPPWQWDYLVPCACGAREDEPCRGIPAPLVHIGRRVKKLLAFYPLVDEELESIMLGLTLGKQGDDLIGVGS